MNWKICLFLLVVEICHSQGDKWVWEGRNSNRRNGEKRYNEELVGVSQPLFKASSIYDREGQFGRYEVTEEPLSYRPPTYRPRPPEQYRPDPDRPVYPYRPTNFVRPTNSLVDNYRPDHSGNGYRPTDGDYSLHGYRPGIGTNGRPILTGPVPSWERENVHKYKDYDVCKCVHSFNCNTPGIKFGSCDADKQYCCYNSRDKEYLTGIGRPEANIYGRPKPVLAGPGGPVGFPTYQGQKPYGRPINHRPVDYSDRDLDEAYRKGLESLHIYETRPDRHRGDRNRYDRYEQNKYDANRENDHNSGDRNRDYGADTYGSRGQHDEPIVKDGNAKITNKNSHPLKYGLYYV